MDDRQSVKVVLLFDTKTKQDRLFGIPDKKCRVSFLEIVRNYIRPYEFQKCTEDIVSILLANSGADLWSAWMGGNPHPLQRHKLKSRQAVKLLYPVSIQYLCTIVKASCGVLKVNLSKNVKCAIAVVLNPWNCYVGIHKFSWIKKV